MPISSSTLVRATAALMLAGLAALLLIVGTTIWLAQRAQTHFESVIAARDARVLTSDLRYALLNAESGQRGFLLTLDEAYLEPYEAAQGSILATLERLIDLLPPSPQNEEAAEVLLASIPPKLAEMARTIALAQDGRRDEALALVRTDQGRELMLQVREILDRIVTSVDAQLTEGVAEQRSSATALRWVAILGALVIIAVVGGSALTVINYTRELVRTRQQLETTNLSLEERVAERTAALASANEEVQRFAYIVTHDLRAPLVNIMGFTSELEASIAPIRQYMERSEPSADDPVEQDARLAATEDLPEAINFIRSSTRKMDGLINAILKISRDGKRPVKIERIALTTLLENAAAAVQHQVGELDGTIEVEQDLPAILSDRLSLEQTFGNLLDNAVKYSDPRRSLRIRITGKPLIGNRIAIDVEDNGRGIAAGDHDRVFELFRRSGEQSKPGEGIGLAHVRSLVRNLGGDITVTSELGKGSTFRVTLARDLRALIGSKT